MLRPRLRTLAAATALTLTAPLALAACGGSDALVIYSGRSEVLVGPLFAQFTEETGIPVEVRYGTSSELAAQLAEEGESTPAEVYFSQDAGALGAVAAAGLLAPLPAEAATLVPEAYRSKDGTWTGVTGRARAIAYDPRQVPAEELPTSVWELTDPKWRGKLAIAPTNASFQSFVTAMRVTDGDERTRAWLEGIVANDPLIYESNMPILEAVDAGQAALGLINHYYWFEKAAEVGADAMTAQLAFTAPKDPGTLVNVAGVGITKSGAEDANAAALVEWLLSPAIQQWFVENTQEYPLLPSVAAADGVPPLDTLRGPDIELAQLEDLPGTLTMLQEVGLL